MCEIVALPAQALRGTGDQNADGAIGLDRAVGWSVDIHPDRTIANPIG